MATSKTSKRKFCSLKYEHVLVTPNQDASQSIRYTCIHENPLISLQTWIDCACQYMAEFFRELKTPPEQSQLALAAYRAALQSSFDKEVYELVASPKEVTDKLEDKSLLTLLDKQKE
jgi:hypothetical protein